MNEREKKILTSSWTEENETEVMYEKRVGIHSLFSRMQKNDETEEERER